MPLVGGHGAGHPRADLLALFLLLRLGLGPPSAPWPSSTSSPAVRPSRPPASSPPWAFVLPWPASPGFRRRDRGRSARSSPSRRRRRAGARRDDPGVAARPGLEALRDRPEELVQHLDVIHVAVGDAARVLRASLPERDDLVGDPLQLLRLGRGRLDPLVAEDEVAMLRNMAVRCSVVRPSRRPSMRCLISFSC